MQSTWAIGEIVAAGVVAVVLPSLGWRAVFFVGVVPALMVFWIRRDVPESPLWLARDKSQPAGSLRVLLQPPIFRNAVLATTMNTLAMFGYWGLFTWIPAYLSLPVDQGGRGFDLMKTTGWLVIMGVGKWFGYALFGFFADTFGRRISYVSYLVVAAALVPLYGLVDDPLALLVLGPFVAFFGTGFFSGFSAIASEIFPTEVRATAMGLTYNLGRALSAVSPAVVGFVAARHGFSFAFVFLAGAFLAAGLLALALPETKGRELA
jgi:MFS family permease